MNAIDQSSEHPDTTLLRSQITRLEAYLQVQLERRDWHGVSDAANDLRVLEAELRILEQR